MVGRDSLLFLLCLLSLALSNVGAVQILTGAHHRTHKIIAISAHNQKPLISETASPSDVQPAPTALVEQVQTPTTPTPTNSTQSAMNSTNSTMSVPIPRMELDQVAEAVADAASDKVAVVLKQAVLDAQKQQQDLKPRLAFTSARIQELTQQISKLEAQLKVILDRTAQRKQARAILQEEIQRMLNFRLDAAAISTPTAQTRFDKATAAAYSMVQMDQQQTTEQHEDAQQTQQQQQPQQQSSQPEVPQHAQALPPQPEALPPQPQASTIVPVYSSPSSAALLEQTQQQPQQVQVQQVPQQLQQQLQVAAPSAVSSSPLPVLQLESPPQQPQSSLQQLQQTYQIQLQLPPQLQSIVPISATSTPSSPVLLEQHSSSSYGLPDLPSLPPLPPSLQHLDSMDFDEPSVINTPLRRVQKRIRS